jgi:hypothetical protein
MPRPSPPQSPPVYTLLGADRRPYQSLTRGALGGHKRSRVYGRLDCPAALRAIARGGYVKTRVFFADEKTAVSAGFRPCAVCLPERYAQWKAAPLRRDRQGRLRRARRSPAPSTSAGTSTPGAGSSGGTPDERDST